MIITELLRKFPDLNTLNLSIQMMLTHEMIDLRPHHIVLPIYCTTTASSYYPVLTVYTIPTPAGCTWLGW